MWFRLALQWTYGVMMLAATVPITGCNDSSSESNQEVVKHKPGAQSSRTVAEPFAIPALPLDRMELIARNQFDAAIARIRAEPESADAIGHLGTLCQAYSFDSSAQACYERAVESDPNSHRWWYLLGTAASDNGYPNIAQSAFHKAHAIKKDDSATIIRLGQSYLDMEQWGMAQEHFTSALLLNTNLGDAHAGLAQALLGEGALDKARQHFRQALEHSPASQTARYGYATVLREQGEKDEALRQFRLAAEAPPETIDHDPLFAAVMHLAKGATAHVQYAVDLLQHRTSPEAIQTAIEYLRKAIELDPERAEAHSQLGTALLTAGDITAAKNALQHAIDLDPRFVDAMTNLGYIANAEGDLDAAIRWYQRATALRSDDFNARYGFAFTLQKSERESEAIEQFELARSMRPDDQRPSQHLNTLYLRHAQYERANQVLAEALSNSPDDAALMQRLAWNLATAPIAKLRDGQRAVQLAEHVAELTNHPRVLDTLAAAYAEVGRFDDAIATARQAIAQAHKSHNEVFAQEIQLRISTYESQRPWRMDHTSE